MKYFTPKRNSINVKYDDSDDDDDDDNKENIDIHIANNANHGTETVKLNRIALGLFCLSSNMSIFFH